MKTLLTTFLMLVGFFAFGQNEDKKPVDMQFDTSFIDLGDVKHGEQKKFQYQFTNNGTEDIEIEIVSGCSCTAADWTKGKIKPGEKGKIDVIFYSEDKKESETVTLDVYLHNIDPEWDSGYYFELNYKFNLLK